MNRELDLLCARARRVAPALGLLFGLFVGGCTGHSDFNSPKSEANPIDAEESSLVAELNMFRQNTGGIMASVIVCTSLNVSASAHADDMRDKDYLSDTAPDGSGPRERACAAGYAPACDTKSGFAEVVAEGFTIGKSTLPQWTMDEKTKPLLLNPSLNVIGVGRSLFGAHPMWAMDMSSVDDPSCH